MIVVYGATGQHGRALCKALADYELEYAIAGRDPIALEELAQSLGVDDVRCASLFEGGLPGVLKDADVVVSCAGPYTDDSMKLISAALDADCHYLDVAAQQPYVRAVYENFDSRARHAERVVCSGCGFETAMADWAAEVARDALGGDEPLDELDISYWIDRHNPSRASQLALLEASSSEGYSWQFGRWVICPAGSESKSVIFPEPLGEQRALSLPSAVLISLPRHIEATKMQCYLCIGAETPLFKAVGAVSPVVAPVLGPLVGSLAKSEMGEMLRATIRSQDPRTLPSSKAPFALVVEATRREQKARVIVSGDDLYTLSAGITCLAAERLMNEGEIGGVLTPAQLLEPKLAIEEMAELYSLHLEVP